MTEIRLALGSVRFEKSVTLSAELGSSRSWGMGGRGTSLIQNVLWDFSGVTKEQTVGARTQCFLQQSVPSMSRIPLMLRWRRTAG